MCRLISYEPAKMRGCTRRSGNSTGCTVARCAEPFRVDRDSVQGPPVPAPDWGTVLTYNMEEIQAPQHVTWDQLGCSCEAGRCA